jgi:glycosyltransferase involved in cell wall biosynthesis
VTMPLAASTIVWKTGSDNIKVASVRIRCILPAQSLEAYGFKSVLLTGNETVPSFERVCAIVFVKTFTRHDLSLARAASSQGVPVYLDLCDNIFIPHYRHSKAFNKFSEMTGLAKAVVTTGQELASVIKAQLEAEVDVVVIPDQFEVRQDLRKLKNFVKQIKPSSLSVRFKSILDNWLPTTKALLASFRGKLIRMLLRVRNGVRESLRSGHVRLRFFALEPRLPADFLRVKAKMIVWFGNAGGGFSGFGIPSLAEISNHLVRLNERVPIKLLVISNNYQAYQELIAPLPLLSAYKAWRYPEIFNDLSAADVCVVPNSKDDFSVCKSPNRSLLALSLGVPVVASSIPSIEDIKDCVILDDWENGLFTYLTDPERVARDVARAKSILEERYSAAVVAGSWAAVLRSAVF